MLGLLKRVPGADDIGSQPPPSTPRQSWVAETSSPEIRKSPGGDLTQGTSPRPKFSRKTPTPVRFAVGGPWALKECEEHTTWVNETLRRARLPFIDDLRRAVSDGVTLVRLLGALEHSPIPGTETGHSLARSEVLVNISRCLSYLADRQVDIAGLDAEDLANGDLRSTLLLVANIRKKYETTQDIRSEGDGGVSSASIVTDGGSTWRPMPGRINVEGGQRGPPTPTKRVSDKPIPPQRRSAFGSPSPGPIIPGSIGRDEADARPPSAHTFYSTTELSSNGVSQIGVDERRQFLSGNPFLPHSRGPRERGPTPVHNRPPQVVAHAWSGGGQSHVQPPFGQQYHPVPSVEDRLKNLIDSKPNAARPAPQHEEGELLVPPSPVPRSYDETVNSGYYHGGHRQGGQALGYVPSKPSERRLGSRVDTIIENSNAKLPPPYPKSQASPRQPYDNPAFTNDEQVTKQAVDRSRPVRAGGDDLRSAWTRLYGAPEWRPATNQPFSQSQNQNPASAQTNSYFGVFTLEPKREQNHNQTQQNSQQNQNHQQYHTQQHQHNYNHHHQQQQQQHNHQQQQPHHPRQSSLDQLSTTVRISPSGQSSHGQQSGSASSSYSGKNAGFSTFKPEEDEDEEVATNTGEMEKGILSDHAIAPSAKYPDQPGSRPSSARQGQGFSSSRQATPVNDMSRSHQQKPADTDRAHAFSRVIPQDKRDIKTFSMTSNIQGNSTPKLARTVKESPREISNNQLSPTPKVRPSRLSEVRHSPHVNPAFVDSDNESGTYQIGASESIFDYASDSTSRSVTPPLPPLSPDSSPRGPPEPLSKYSRSYSTSNISPPKTPDLLSSTSRPNLDKRDLRASSGQIDMAGVTRHGKKAPRINPAPRQHKSRTNLSRVHARSLEDLRESENESNLSFDVENTMLMVEPESEQFSGSENISPKDAKALRQQLQGLESAYHQVLKQAGPEFQRSNRRRWSIGSSDTSSINRGKRFRTSATHRNYSRDIKAIQRRFQKLESHVVTLARSVAHLSSELRNQTSVSHEIGVVKRELRELRQQQHVQSVGNIPGLNNNNTTDYEKFRGWIPSLTNPKRVNKLTKFFGQEPPLLEIFLQKLGYERYAKNFANEHIGMIELPYMTEDRLQTIGIPMGPRLRILQEAQLCFRQENFNIYIV